MPALLQPRIHLLWYLVHWCAAAAREIVCGLLQQAGAAAEAIGPWCDVCIGGSTVEDLRGLTDAQWECMFTAGPPLNLALAQRFNLVNNFKRATLTRELARSPRPIAVVRARRVVRMPILRLACCLGWGRWFPRYDTAAGAVAIAAVARLRTYVLLVCAACSRVVAALLLCTTFRSHTRARLLCVCCGVTAWLCTFAGLCNGTRPRSLHKR